MDEEGRVRGLLFRLKQEKSGHPNPSLPSGHPLLCGAPHRQHYRIDHPSWANRCLAARHRFLCPAQKNWAPEQAPSRASWRRAQGKRTSRPSSPAPRAPRQGLRTLAPWRLAKDSGQRFRSEAARCRDPIPRGFPTPMRRRRKRQRPFGWERPSAWPGIRHRRRREASPRGDRGVVP